MDLREAEDIKKWQDYTELYKKISIVTVFIDRDLGTGVDDKRDAGDTSLK